MSPVSSLKSADGSASVGSGKNPNIWIIISIILAIALVGFIVKDKVKGSDSDVALVTVGDQEAASTLLGFVNEVFGPQVGAATLKSVGQESGLYRVTVNVLDQQGQPIDQVIYITRDGKMFVPQAIDIQAALTEFRAYQQQQQQLPTDATNTDLNLQVQPEADAPGGTAE